MRPSVNDALVSDGLKPLGSIQGGMPKVIEYVITDEGIPADHLILDGVDLSEGPTYTIGELAKFFFGRSDHWVRWRERNDMFVFDGVPVGTQRTETGIRFYSLADVEKMGHALAENNKIDGYELSLILKLVLFEARVWKLI